MLSKDYATNKKIYDNLTRVKAEDGESKYILQCGYWDTVQRIIVEKADGQYILFGGLIGGVFAIVAIIMLWNFAYTTILDSKKDIGILRALGAKKHEVALIFIFEFTILLIIANVLSVVIMPIYQRYLGDVNECIHMFNFKTWMWFADLGFSLIVTLLSTGLSIYKFVKKKPIEIIRS